jgi:hypothetical protein
MVAAVVGRFGKLDILINNLAQTSRSTAPCVRTATLERIEAILLPTRYVPVFTKGCPAANLDRQSNPRVRRNKGVGWANAGIALAHQLQCDAVARVRAHSLTNDL